MRIFLLILLLITGCGPVTCPELRVYDDKPSRFEVVNYDQFNTFYIVTIKDKNTNKHYFVGRGVTITEMKP